jgi:hypothetical protein
MNNNPSQLHRYAQNIYYYNAISRPPLKTIFCYRLFVYYKSIKNSKAQWFNLPNGENAIINKIQDAAKPPIFIGYFGINRSMIYH